MRAAAASTARPDSIAPQLLRTDSPDTPRSYSACDQHVRHTAQPEPAHRQRRALGASATASRAVATAFIHLFSLCLSPMWTHQKLFPCNVKNSAGFCNISAASRKLRERIRRRHVRLIRISPDRRLPRSSALAFAGVPQMSDIARDPQAALSVSVARTRYSLTDSRYHSRIPLTRIIRVPTLSP